MEGLVQCSANYVPLTPISFLERAAIVHGDKTSIVYGTNFKCCWRQTYERCLKLASALSKLNVSRGDIVAALAQNVPALYELHFGVPMAGAILSALNPSLDAPTLSILLKKLDPKVIFVDYKSTQLFQEATKSDPQSPSPNPFLIVIPELDQLINSSIVDFPLGDLDYDNLLASGSTDFEIVWPNNEKEPISINFTSGSTGIPKAAVYSHRATYLNSIGMTSLFEIQKPPIFLWTVDMFRCNGWCFPWAMAAFGGTNICLRENYSATSNTLLNLIVHHKATLLCGKPLLLNQLAGADSPEALPCRVDVIVSGILPSVDVIKGVKEMGFNVKVGYGMTEALGPAVIRTWDPEDDVAQPTNSGLLGTPNIMLRDVDVKDPITMRSVPDDGTTLGEVMFKSNTLMTGNLNDPELTEKAFTDGWYKTRDIGVRLPNGRIQLKDRAADIIVVGPGGQFVSSIEVEEVLVNHSDVAEAAVVGSPNEPYAFVKLKEGSEAKEKEIIEFCAERLPSHMVPSGVRFGDLPKNSTGKIQKFVLRDRAKANGKCAD